MVLEASSPKSRYWQGHGPSEICKGGFFLASSSLVVAVRPGHPLTGSWITPVSASDATHASALCVSALFF